ncbi:hypothetical protein [Rhizorhabdus dicambivorans]|nr:hypothetical protein [Rhizorhabdus dicambivorans]
MLEIDEQPVIACFGGQSDYFHASKQADPQPHRDLAGMKALPDHILR